jgi:uncharacterized protein YbjT (DUF2867 family)
MILIVGATGDLGGHIARQLLQQGHPVRAMTRDPRRARGLADAGAEVVRGDLRNMDSLRGATRGVHAIVSASHSVMGAWRSSSKRVDDVGQRALIAAAKEAGVGHFVFISAMGAADSHPVDFFRTKARIESHLKRSGLSHTILRPGPFMEFHTYKLIGQAVRAGKRVVLFGDGINPRNYVAAGDVAKFVLLALSDVRLRNATLEIGGPDNLSGMQVVKVFERLTGMKARVTHVRLPVLRVLSRLSRPVHSGLSRILKVGVVTATTNQRFDAGPSLARFPVVLTHLEDWARARIASA